MHRKVCVRGCGVQVPNQPDGYEFSIRTPVTPPRWADFDQELEAAWEGVVAALVAGGWLRGVGGRGGGGWWQGGSAPRPALSS